MKAEQLQIAIRERRKMLREASRELANGVSLESDRWFLSSLGALDRGLQWTDHRVSSFVRRMCVWRGQPPKQRIQELLRKEAKRAKLTMPDEDIRVFADKLTTLMDLVLSGAVAIDDIVFEDVRAQAATEEHRGV